MKLWTLWDSGALVLMRRFSSEGSLSDGQADFSFEDLLSFVAGADRLPLFRLSTLISLRFYSQVGNCLRIFLLLAESY